MAKKSLASDSMDVEAFEKDQQQLKLLTEQSKKKAPSAAPDVDADDDG
jgi:hypothetical protein